MNLPIWLIQLYNLLFNALDAQGMPWQEALAAAWAIVSVIAAGMGLIPERRG